MEDLFRQYNRRKMQHRYLMAQMNKKINILKRMSEGVQRISLDIKKADLRRIK